MSRAKLMYALILILLVANTLSGVLKVGGFMHRFSARKAFRTGDMNTAYMSLRNAAVWWPGDASTFLQIGRVIAQAEANGLTLEALQGLDPQQKLSLALSATVRGIALNPADGTGWFRLASLYRSVRTSRIRAERMRLLIEAAASGGDLENLPTAERRHETPRLDPEDLISVAATFKAVDLEPTYYRYHDALAALYWDRGLEEEAARAIRDSFALNPEPWEHTILEETELTNGLADAILEGMDRASSNRYINPIETLRSRSYFLSRIGRHAEAAASFKELRQAAGEKMETECDLELGKLEYRQGRYEESIALLNRVIERESEQNKGYAAIFYIGLAHAKLNEHQTAAEMFRVYRTNRPDSRSGYLALADELEILGREDEAVDVYNAAIQRFPEDRTVHDLAIRFLRGRGRTGEALVHAEALLRLDPDDEEIEALVEQLKEEAGRTLR